MKKHFIILVFLPEVLEFHSTNKTRIHTNNRQDVLSRVRTDQLLLMTDEFKNFFHLDSIVGLQYGA